MKRVFIALIVVICVANLFACTKSDNLGIAEEDEKHKQEVKVVTEEEDYTNFISKIGSYIYTFDSAKEFLAGDNITIYNVETLAVEQIDVLDEAINTIANIETSTTEITNMKINYINSLSLLKDVYFALYKTGKGEIVTEDVSAILTKAIILYSDFVNKINEYESKY